MSHQESTAPTAWNIAAELRRIAEALENAVGPDTRLYASVDLGSLSADDLDEDARVVLIDALAVAIVGSPAQHSSKLSSGNIWHGVRDSRGGVAFSAWCTVADPAEVSEVERLRAELAEAKAALAARDSRPQMAMESEDLGAIADADPRCPDPECGESLREIEAGRVGHCGRNCDLPIEVWA